MIGYQERIRSLCTCRVALRDYADANFFVVPFIHNGSSDNFIIRRTIKIIFDTKVAFKYHFIQAPFGWNYDLLRILFKRSSIGV